MSLVSWVSAYKIKLLFLVFSRTHSDVHVYNSKRFPGWRLAARRHTFPSTTETLAAGEDSAVEAAGKMWKLASLGDRTISFWRYRRWWRSLETQASNQSWDFTWNRKQGKTAVEAVSWLPRAGTNRISPPTPSTANTGCRRQFHLQVIDVLLRVKVYSPSFLFNWHDRQANVNAPMDLPLLDLKSKD